MTLTGYIGRTELQYAIEKSKRSRDINADAICFFSPEVEGASVQTPAASDVPDDDPYNTPRMTDAPAIPSETMQNASSTAMVDFAQWMDQIPMTVQPGLPLETVMELFRKMGPRIILVEHAAEGGKLVGVITVKDVLKYIAKTEHEHDHPKWPTERPYRDEESVPASPTLHMDDYGAHMDDDDDDELYSSPNTNLDAAVDWFEENILSNLRRWTSRFSNRDPVPLSRRLSSSHHVPRQDIFSLEDERGDDEGDISLSNR